MATIRLLALALGMAIWGSSPLSAAVAFETGATADGALGHFGSAERGGFFVDGPL